jgi:hypothetical protein
VVVLVDILLELEQVAVELEVIELQDMDLHLYKEQHKN